MFLFTLTLFAAEWIETTQQDFADGSFEVNLYASRRGDGAMEFVGRFDLNNDGYIDIPGCSWIMWGSSSGYSADNITEYNGGGGCDAADFNADGCPDFVTTLMGGSDQIFWGNTEGPDPFNESVISVDAYNNEGIMAADFNKDGYLDLLASIDDDNAAIFLGSATGYSETNSTSLPCWKTGYNPGVADLNKDGWLDVVLISGESPDNYIYWGSQSGFSVTGFTHVIAPWNIGGHGISVADLNYDDWLDIVYSQNRSGINYADILWGNSSVYRPDTEVTLKDQLPLPDRAFGGSSIADLNRDGYLDIVFFGNDDVPPRIFWGDSKGISATRYSDLGLSFSVGSSGFVADFNWDGNLDIFEGDYYGSSAIFYGPGFSNYKLFDIGSHHGFSREIGNVYTRKYSEEYCSSIFDAQMDVGYIELSWQDSCPGQSRIRFAVRTGEKPDSMYNWFTWAALGNGKHLDLPKEIPSEHRYIQYKAIFEYDNPAQLPVLEEVRIKYEETEGVTDWGISSANQNLVVKPDKRGWVITFSVAKSGLAEAVIYDATGARVRTLMAEVVSQGNYSLSWDGLTEKGIVLPQGVYFVQLKTGGVCQTAKLLMSR